MKKSIFIVILFLTSIVSAFSQTDKIKKLNGDSLEVIIKKVSQTEIEYSYVNEDLIQSINKSNVSCIVYKSGRVEKFAEVIVINGESDWEKVTFTTIEADVKDLTKVGEVAGKHMIVFGKESKIRLIATEKIKREAAKLGAHTVYLYEDKFELDPINNVSLRGFAYKY